MVSAATPASVPEVIAIGGSAGALDALTTLLPLLPVGLAAAVLVVVHVAPGRPSLLPQILAQRSRLPVREPTDKEQVAGGVVWIAPPDYHLLIERDRSFAFSIDEPVHFSRPSIDVLFQSAADAYGAGLLCVVLTGASRDGALGAAAVRRAGGRIAVQDPATAEAALLPRAALELTSADFVGSVAELGGYLLRSLGGVA